MEVKLIDAEVQVNYCNKSSHRHQDKLNQSRLIRLLGSVDTILGEPINH
jgi:hypothetical protein